MTSLQPSHDVELHRELLLRVGKGETRAFNVLYDLFSKPLAALAYRILGNAEEVDEVVQDTFLAVWKHAVDYDPALSRPFSWMIVITRRLCWNRLRSKGRHDRKLSALEMEGMGPVIPESERLPSVMAEQHEFSEKLQDRLMDFPEKQERVIHMALFDGFTHEEIAGVMDLPLGTVKTWIRRGLLRIRDELEAQS